MMMSLCPWADGHYHHQPHHHNSKHLFTQNTTTVKLARRQSTIKVGSVHHHLSFYPWIVQIVIIMLMMIGGGEDDISTTSYKHRTIFGLSSLVNAAAASPSLLLPKPISSYNISEAASFPSPVSTGAPLTSLSLLTLDKSMVKLTCDFEQDLCSWRHETKYNGGLKWKLSPIKKRMMMTDKMNDENLSISNVPPSLDRGDEVDNGNEDKCDENGSSSGRDSDTDGCLSSQSGDVRRSVKQSETNKRSNRYLYITSHDLPDNSSFVRISHFPLAARNSGYCYLSLKYIAHGIGFAKLIIGLRLIDHNEIEPILVIFSSKTSQWHRVKVPLIASYVFTPVIEARRNTLDSENGNSKSHGDGGDDDGYIAIDDTELSRGCVHDPTDDGEDMKAHTLSKIEFNQINNKQKIRRDDFELEPNPKSSQSMNHNISDGVVIESKDSSSAENSAGPKMIVTNEQNDVSSGSEEEEEDGGNTLIMREYLIPNSKNLKKLKAKKSKIKKISSPILENYQINKVVGKTLVNPFKPSKLSPVNSKKSSSSLNQNELEKAILKTLQKQFMPSPTLRNFKLSSACDGRNSISRNVVGLRCDRRRLTQHQKIEQTIVCESDQKCTTTTTKTSIQLCPSSCNLDDIHEQDQFRDNCGWTQDRMEAKYGTWLLISEDYASQHNRWLPVIETSPRNNGKYLVLDVKQTPYTPAIHLNSPLFYDAKDNCYFTFSYAIHDRNAIFYLHLVTLTPVEIEEEGDDVGDAADDVITIVNQPKKRGHKKGKSNHLEYDETTYILWKSYLSGRSNLGHWSTGSGYIGRQKNLFYLSFVRSSAPYSPFGTIALDNFNFISC